MRFLRPLLVGLILAIGLGTLAGASEAPTRGDYVERLEKTCKPGAEATRRAVKGVKADVRSGHLTRAAPKVAKAKRIFAHTVSVIAQVPRPTADRTTLARWFRALEREISALGRTVEALRADDAARFERTWSDFVHEGAKANNIVVSFGFDYCAFRSSRFE
jgi:hypothetical protein